MTRETVGVYLQTLREGLGFSRQDIAHAMHTSYPQITRIEQGAARVNAEQIAEFTSLVFGKAEDVFHLLQSATVSSDQSRQLAHQQLAEIFRSKSTEELEEIRAAVARRRGDA